MPFPIPQWAAGAVNTVDGGLLLSNFILSAANAGGNQQLLTAASGNFTVPAGITRLNIAMTGGGGGTGGVASAAATTAGGSSGMALRLVMTVTPAQVIAFTCVAGGTGGSAGNNPGADGGVATFGPVTAVGGLGTVGSAAGNGAAPSGTTLSTYRGAAGFTPDPTTQWLTSTQTINVGQAGTAGVGGLGGYSFFGKPGIGVINSAGTSATGYGAGASGAGLTAATGAVAGGNGGPPAILVWW
jgi:hypothetical protein